MHSQGFCACTSAGRVVSGVVVAFGKLSVELEETRFPTVLSPADLFDYGIASDLIV
jgi:hypothetical protein